VGVIKKSIFRALECYVFDIKANIVIYIDVVSNCVYAIACL